MRSSYSLPRSQPEAQGVASKAIAAFIQAVEEKQLELHSFMLVKHGHVIAEGWWDPYKAEMPHTLFSLSKSFTATAIGMAAEEGILSLEDQVISFFPDDLPSEVSANLAAMQIKHLLMMGTGHALDTLMALWEQAEGNWAKAFLKAPIEHLPGTLFVYNTGATYMLSAIIQKVSGLKLLDYLQPRLLEPLGIIGAAWDSCPRGIHIGGYGLNITTEDIAKFAQLYLQKGIWNGTRLLTEAWVAAATSMQISNGDEIANDWMQGYGYQFWRNQPSGYRADGAFSQYGIVLPEQDCVIAITSGISDMQGLLNQVWEILLPALGSEGALAPDESVAAALQVKLAGLKYSANLVLAESPREAGISGQRYQFENDTDSYSSFSIQFAAEEATAVFKIGDEVHSIQLGRGKWVAGTTSLIQGVTMIQGVKRRVMSSFTWRDENTLEFIVRLVETAFYQTFLCHFEGDNLQLEGKINLAFAPTEFVTSHGKLIR